MYGLINNAVKDCIAANYGPNVWGSILQQAGYSDMMFSNMESYPDEVTYNLVGAASTVLEVDAADLLKVFGRFWVMSTARNHYKKTLDFAGSDLVTFLQNLDRMHDQVAATFKNLRQPSFTTEILEDGSLHVHYESFRDGLAPFVVGLLEGLAMYFVVTISIEQIAYKGVDDHDIFHVIIED
jgi:hypothetical protein